MLAVLLTVHMFACLALVISVMLQRSEGGALGMGGGGTGGLISGRGAASVLVRTTMVLAAIFFVTSIVMTRMNAVDLNAPGALQKSIEQKSKSNPLDPLAPASGAPSSTPAPAAPVIDPLAPVVAPPANPTTPVTTTTPAAPSTTPPAPPAISATPAPAPKPVAPKPAGPKPAAPATGTPSTGQTPGPPATPPENGGSPTP